MAIAPASTTRFHLQTFDGQNGARRAPANNFSSNGVRNKDAQSTAASRQSMTNWVTLYGAKPLREVGAN
jgi:hypothetical protein